MTEVEKLLNSVLTVTDGTKMISELEMKSAGFTPAKSSVLEKTASLIRDFKDEFYKTEVVSMTLAIEPSREFLSELQSWFSSSAGERVIFDLKVDPQIIGGIKLICRNHFRDFSLSSIIEDTTKDEFNQDQHKGKEAGMIPSSLI